MAIEIALGDITRIEVDAIVNAANSRLLGGGGVDGAIHRAAGPELLVACRKVGGCPTGEARLTRGYRLPARYVIHTVAPVWQGGGRGEPELLAACYRNSLRLAFEHELGSVAFPAIGCGAYGYPLDGAARIAVDEIRAFVASHAMPRRVLLVAFDEPTCRAYRRAVFAGGAPAPRASSASSPGPGEAT